MVRRVGALGDEAATDVANWVFDPDQGFVWVRVGSATRPSGLFGLEFAGAIRDVGEDRYHPLIGFADAALAIVESAEERTRRRLQQEVFELIAAGARLDDVLVRVCALEETGTSGLRCVAWVPTGDGGLRPLGTGASAAARSRVVVCPDDSPVQTAMRTGRGGWLRRDPDRPGSLGPLATALEASAVALMPVPTVDGSQCAVVLAVYDLGAVPVMPETDADGVPVGPASSIAAVAVRRLGDLAELRRRASRDVLTGLANRATLIGELERALVEADPDTEKVAVLYCDVDRFKELNDRMGHDRGDRLLVELGGLIADQVPPGSVVARLGGDEFVILLRGRAHGESARLAAERIRSAVLASRTGERYATSISIGVAESGSVGDHAEGLLRDADVAMYRAKSSGPDRVEVFSEHLRREARERDRLARDLAEALTGGDIGVHFQPMLDLTSGDTVGLEALARWEHPERGFVPPDEFIPIAEGNGLIGRLGEVVLDHALGAAAGWPGLDLHVNLSAQQVDTPGAGVRLVERIRRSDVPLERVVLEVTESVLLSGSAPTVTNLHALTDAGMGLVLDDFGTGYASLTYLRRFPFKGLKVDQSIVAGVDRSPDDATIVSMVVALGTAMGLRVVAEGVETSAQEDALRRVGCRFVQGHRYSEAVPAEGVPALLDAARSR